MIDRFGIKIQKRKKKDGNSIFGIGPYEKESDSDSVDFLLNYSRSIDEKKNIPIFLIGFDRDNEYYYLEMLQNKNNFHLLHLIDYHFPLEVGVVRQFQIGKIILQTELVFSEETKTTSITLKLLNQEKNTEIVYDFKSTELPITIGRYHCSINIKNSSVSKSHVTIDYSTEHMEYYIKDNNSTNGTFLLLDNGGKVILWNKMQFKLNDSKFTITQIE